LAAFFYALIVFMLPFRAVIHEDPRGEDLAPSVTGSTLDKLPAAGQGTALIGADIPH